MENIEIVDYSHSQDNSELNTPTIQFFLNRPAESPWKNCAPHIFPYNKQSRNYIYNVLDFDKWQHFTKEFILNALMKESFQDAPKYKRWRDLCGYFCVFPNDKISAKELAYIYECIYEMPTQNIAKLLQNLSLLTFQKRGHPLQEQQIPPSILQESMFQLNQLPVNLQKLTMEHNMQHLNNDMQQLNKLLSSLELPIQVTNGMLTTSGQGSSNASSFEPSHITNGSNNMTLTAFLQVPSTQRNVFKRPSGRPISSKSAQKKLCLAKNSNPQIQDTSNKNGTLQLGNPTNCMYLPVGMPQLDGIQTMQNNVPVQYPACAHKKLPKTKYILPKAEARSSNPTPQTCLHGSNFEINDSGDIIFFGIQNVNNTNQNGNDNHVLI